MRIQRERLSAKELVVKSHHVTDTEPSTTVTGDISMILTIASGRTMMTQQR